MEFLKWLQAQRTPLLDSVFSGITHLGEETFFIVVGILFFWCISKREGYFLLSTGLVGTVLNQFLKLLCRIPRPWVLDETFAIVESARAEATGYSFPSGHTQMAAGLYGGIARCHRGWVRIVGIVLALLIAFSRLYLGVHTTLDVGVSLLIATALVLVLYPLMHKVTANDRLMRILLCVMVLIAAGNLAFVTLYPFWYVLCASFSDPNLFIRKDFVLLFKPLGWSLEAYRQCLTPRVMTGYSNTLFYVVAGTLLSMLLTFLGAYALSRKGWLGKRFITLMIMFTMYFSGGIIAIYLWVEQLGMIDTRWAILLYTTLPASYLAPSLGRKQEDYTMASGVCSVLTIPALIVFCIIAVIVS